MIEGSTYEAAAACETLDRDEGLERLWLTEPLTLGNTEAVNNWVGVCGVFNSGDATTGVFVNGRVTEEPRSLVPGVHTCGDPRADSVARLRLVVGSGVLLVAACGARGRSDVMSLEDLVAGRKLASDEDAGWEWVGDVLRRLDPCSDVCLW